MSFDEAIGGTKELFKQNNNIRRDAVDGQLEDFKSGELRSLIGTQNKKAADLSAAFVVIFSYQNNIGANIDKYVLQLAQV